MHVDRTSRRLARGVEDAADSGAVQPDGVCAIGIFTGPQEQIDAGDFGPVPGKEIPVPHEAVECERVCCGIPPRRTSACRNLNLLEIRGEPAAYCLTGTSHEALEEIAAGGEHSK